MMSTVGRLRTLGRIAVAEFVLSAVAQKTATEVEDADFTSSSTHELEPKFLEAEGMEEVSSVKAGTFLQAASAEFVPDQHSQALQLHFRPAAFPSGCTPPDQLHCPFRDAGLEPSAPPPSADECVCLPPGSAPPASPSRGQGAAKRAARGHSPRPAAPAHGRPATSPHSPAPGSASGGAGGDAPGAPPGHRHGHYAWHASGHGQFHGDVPPGAFPPQFGPPQHFMPEHFMPHPHHFVPPFLWPQHGGHPSPSVSTPPPAAAVPRRAPAAAAAPIVPPAPRGVPPPVVPAAAAAAAAVPANPRTGRVAPAGRNPGAASAAAPATARVGGGAAPHARPSAAAGGTSGAHTAGAHTTGAHTAGASAGITHHEWTTTGPGGVPVFHRLTVSGSNGGVGAGGGGAAPPGQFGAHPHQINSANGKWNDGVPQTHMGEKLVLAPREPRKQRESCGWLQI